MPFLWPGCECGGLWDEWMRLPSSSCLGVFCQCGNMTWWKVGQREVDGRSRRGRGDGIGG